MGVVIKPDEGALHFDLDGEDLLVEVELQPSKMDITCRMGSAFGGGGVGAWRVPNVGEEVVVLIPEGDVKYMPIIVASLSTGNLPNGVAENTIVIAEGQVLIHDGNGGAAELVTMAEFRAHTHPDATGGTGPTLDPIPGLGPITGTTVLKAK